jgi:hypothetical protein
MFNKQTQTKRSTKWTSRKKATWQKEVVNLKAHEVIIEKSLKEKAAEVESAKVVEVKEIHEKARTDLLNALLNTVKQRTQFELNLLLIYEDVTVDEEIFIESEEESEDS